MERSAALTPKRSTTWLSQEQPPLLRPHYIFVRGPLALAVALHQDHGTGLARWTLSLCFRTRRLRDRLPWRFRPWRNRVVWELPLSEWTYPEETHLD